jgi:hypothetical protein
VITDPNCVAVFCGDLGVFMVENAFEDDFEFGGFSDFLYCLPCHTQVSVFQV